ncbi:sushi, von Willebrand factor type A, EGF and pentraxin domain-containing protein 1-like [Branchiostoma floridae]|uniref:Sushi, von Willebrand factor type A, EGF and pentraxin domain-containing protein 1-like n=1 Tax=Branchiostoma floridae TaxID=7739 RepID=A0A9J7HS91_BRAFL|nr:sushi, von Willebrand factor type A, EGF and pentraxin domain-containing protein 1-like [Branchiostoma floridae]
MEQHCSNMRIQCPALTAPTNGIRTPATGANLYQDTITFSCNNGYVRVGDFDTRCQANGQWSNPVPTCTPRQCPALTPPANGALSSAGSYFYPNQVTVTCNSGYQRNGVSPVTCQADGTWSNPVPTCTPVQCPALIAPTYGALNPPAGPYVYQNQVTVTCNSGYQLNGVSSLTCQADGTWSNNVPTCEPRQCPVLNAPTNGARTPPTGSNLYQNQVTFTCNAGYDLDGVSPVTCQADGIWSNPVPVCRPRCPALTAPNNGARTPPTGQNSYQDVIRFTCNSGYVRNGAFDTTCQADGTWSNPVPTCERRQCPDLTAPTNGALSPPAPHNYPATVTFTCNTGYVRNGAETTTCQADGSWSNPTPTCIPGQCSTLTAPTNGALTPLGATSLGNTVTFTCNLGYLLYGATTSTCQAGGTWSNPVPTCTPVSCPALTAPTNGALNPPAGPYVYQNQVTVTCNLGYDLDGVSPVTCQADGTWSNPVGTCRRRCPALTAPTNGVRTPSTGSNSFGNTVTFTCNTGYVRNGAAAVTCQADGTWSNPVPTCTPRPCQALTAPTNGALSPAAPHNFPTTVRFTCDSGYVRNGAQTTVCQTDGSWSNPTATCTRGQCSALTAPTNGALSPLGATSSGNTVTFTCNPGYVRNGAVTSTCQADGTWSNPVPTCPPRQCPRLTAPSNGTLSPPGPYSYTNTVTVTCQAGYQLNGVSPVTSETVYEDVRTPDRAVSQRSGTGSDVYSYPMAPLHAPPLPVQPSGHYQELRPAVYQSLQRNQRTIPQSQSATISHDFSR